jgi:hypothetical protein
MLDGILAVTVRTRGSSAKSIAGTRMPLGFDLFVGDEKQSTPTTAFQKVSSVARLFDLGFRPSTFHPPETFCSCH